VTRSSPKVRQTLNSVQFHTRPRPGQRPPRDDEDAGQPSAARSLDEIPAQLPRNATLGSPSAGLA
jgi:hypothetical protein